MSSACCRLIQVSTHIRVVFCVLVAACTLVSTAQAGSRATALSQSESSLLGVVNGVRADHGLRPLRVDPALTRAARTYSATMLRTNRFTHGAMGARLASHGARGPVFGENLAWGVGRRSSAAAIVRGWLESPGHRANLLRPGFRRIGIGSLTGRFAGYGGATVVTADFAGH